MLFFAVEERKDGTFSGTEWLEPIKAQTTQAALDRLKADVKAINANLNDYRIKRVSEETFIDLGGLVE